MVKNNSEVAPKLEQRRASMKERKYNASMKRRRFIKTTLTGLAVLPAVGDSILLGEKRAKKAKIALVKRGDRQEAVKQLLTMVDFASPKGKKVFIKPNFNTADPCPGSTHNDTLGQLVKELRQRGAAAIAVGDRSGPQPTDKVLEAKGIFRMAKELNFQVANFSQLADQDWLHFNPAGNHWQEGFYLARPAAEADYLVTSHCLKTHQYGGIFTLSLKLTVGMAPAKLMRELHGSPHMRRMIAELNQPFQPRLLVMDGLEAFVDGGPMTGTRKRADVFLAGTDRVAMDAVGVAILKELGSNEAIMGPKIFDQEQIARAAELGLGVKGAEQIELITADPASRSYAKKVREILLKG
jgi:uncharacterized protein (DUF362 family)